MLRKRSLLLLSVLILLLGLILGLVVGWSVGRSGGEKDPPGSASPTPLAASSTTPAAPPRAGALAAPPGPSGLNWPDHTPAYETAATTEIDDLAELNEALSEADAGDVIEVAPQTYAGGELVISEGDDGWAKNVLVRPPLGKRQSVVVDNRPLVIDAPHVTIAGFQAREINIAERGDRSAFARIVMTEDSFIKASARGDVGDDHVLEDAGFYEIVAPEVRTDSGNAEDRMNISGYGTGPDGEVGEVVGLTLAGLWLEGSYREHGSDSHVDTLQTFGAAGSPPPRDLTVLNSVLFASTNAAWQAGDGGVAGTWTIRNSLMMNCQHDDSGKVPDGYDCGGTNTFNTALGVDPDAKVVIRDSRLYGSVRHPDLPFVLEDVCADNLADGAESGPVEDEGGNVLGEQAVAAKCAHVDPKLPDLDAIWE